MIDFIPHISATSCAAVAAASGSTFARAFGVLTLERRAALAVVYAVFRILDDCVDELDDPIKQNAALNYWQERILAAYEGQSDHPIGKELEAVVTRFKIPREYFTGLIDGCRQDIVHKQLATLTELYDYCYRVASLVGLCCLKIFEYTSPTAEQMAIDLGQAFQLTNILRDVKSDLERGRIYLTTEVLSRHGCTHEMLRTGASNAEFLAAMDELNALAEKYYAAAWTEFSKDNEGKLAAARLMALSYRMLLRKMARQRWPVFAGRIGLNSWEKIRLAFTYYFCRTAA